MTNGNDWLLWLIILGAGLLFLFVPQWLARRRQAQRVAEFAPGDLVITIGGFLGVLKEIDLEENVAILKLAEDLEVEILPGALSRKLVPEIPEGPEGPEEPTDVA
jgi:preprotein translocase YajC subunit